MSCDFCCFLSPEVVEAPEMTSRSRRSYPRPVPICHVQSAAIIQGKYWRSQYLRQRLRLFKQDMDDDRHRCFEGGRKFSVPPRSLFLWRLMKTIHNSHPRPAAPRLTDTMILRLLAPLPLPRFLSSDQTHISVDSGLLARGRTISK